jgi:hypothetical protein
MRPDSTARPLTRSVILALAVFGLIIARPSAQFDFFKEVERGVQSIGEGIRHVVNEADKIRVQTQPVDVDFRNGGIVRFNWGGIAETRYDPRRGAWGPLKPGIVVRGPNDLCGGSVGQGIRYSRDRARGSSGPIPPWVRQVMAPFFSNEVLSAVRYTFDWGAAANFTAQQPALASGNFNAIALNDTIVFRNRTLESGYYTGQPFSVEAFNWDSAYLWAHELTHLEQYRSLGTEDFGKQLCSNYDGNLERPAQVNGDRVAKLIADSASRLSSRSQRPRCLPGSGAIYRIDYPSGQFFIFGDCHSTAYRYYPEAERREEEPSGRVLPSGRGYTAIDNQGNWYFAQLVQRR